MGCGLCEGHGRTSRSRVNRIQVIEQGRMHITHDVARAYVTCRTALSQYCVPCG